MKHLPNFLTLLNLFFGSIAVVLAIKDQPLDAAILILICAVLDFADGLAARLLNGRSELGMQLDSLADLVSFGMGSSAIMFHYLYTATQTQGEGFLITALPFVAFLLVVFSGLRLAIFNIDSRQTESFIGLPTPANAFFFASFPIVIAYGNPTAIHDIAIFFTSSIPVMLLGILVFAGLMVSPLPMFSLKVKSLSWRKYKIQYVFLIVVAVVLILEGINALLLIILAYLLLSIVQLILNLNTKHQ